MSDHNRYVRHFYSVSRYTLCLALILSFSALPHYGFAAHPPGDTLRHHLANANYDAVVELMEANNQHYLFELLTNARARKLYKTPTWRALLHYKKNLLGATTSQVDSRDFFLSRKGKYNPQAELEATLASFFSDKPVPPTQLSPQCRFVARFHWLNSQLGFDFTRLNLDPCPKFKKFSTSIDAQAATLVFASTHPNSPSSMFGHTLLRFDKKGQTSTTRMLAHTIHYAAQVDVENDLLYAYLGISGGFKGRFRILPYYMKLREYSQMENRGLWEYSLNLTPKQINFILMHAYELVPSYFNYYFFSENCAYHLLSLLEVAIPEKKLTDAFRGWTIPIDTVRLLEKKRLIERTVYHPAQNTVIVERQKELSKDENSLALQLLHAEKPAIDQELATLPVDRQKLVLDLLYDYLRYDQIKQADVLAPTVTPKEHQVLLARSKLGPATHTSNAKTLTTRPDRGHQTARIGFGMGVHEDQRFFELAWRGAYHDLLDSNPGYQPNSQLEFFNLRLRFLKDSYKLELYRLDLVDIISLEPRKTFFKDVSWQARGGIQSIVEHDGDIRHYISLNTGAGSTYLLNDSLKTHIYSLINGQADYGKLFDEDYRFLAGPSIGLLTEVTDKWKLHAKAGYLKSLFGDERDSATLTFTQSYALTGNVSLRLEFRRTLALDDYVSEIFGQIHIYH